MGSARRSRSIGRNCRARPGGPPGCRARPRAAAGTAKRALKSGTKRSLRKRLAAATVVIFARRNSCGSRPCKVPNIRSMRPRALILSLSKDGRVGGDVGDAELGQRASDLGRLGLVDLAAGLGRVEAL